MREFDIKRQGRRLGIAVLLLLVLLGAGSLISVPVDGERAARLLRPTLSALFGPDVTLDLSASLSILPRPTLEINGLNISKKDKILIKARTASAPVGVIGLLSGGLSASSLTINEPVLMLPPSAVPDTRQSAVTLLGGLIAASETNEARALDTVTIRSGRVMISGDIPLALVEKIDADLSLSASGRLTLDLRTLWKNEAIELSSRIDPTDTKTGTKAASLSIKSAPVTLTLEGTLTTAPELNFIGKSDLSIKALDRLSTWLEIDPPLTFTTPLTVKGMAEMTGDRVAIRDADISLGKIEMKGGIGLDVAGQRPLVFGSLSAGDMDVTEFLRPLWPKQAQGWRTDPLASGLTPEQDFDVRLSAERVNLGIVRIANLAVSIIAKDRALDLTLGGSKLFQGSAKGKLSIQPDNHGYRVAAHGSFDNIDLAQATLAFMDMRKIEGTTEGKFDFESRGTTSESIMKALSGTTDVSITNGTLNGINLANVLKRIETRPLSAIRDMKGGKTDFDRAHVSATIANGNATLEKAEMLFAPNGMTMTGEINIGERRLTLEGLATGPDPENGTAPAILPYTVTGSFDDPILTPDVGRILKRQGTTPEQ
ncbi:MAG: AsmA family protein [Alphaproteobacteria bacterium]